jgi:hypothetical protein
MAPADLGGAGLGRRLGISSMADFFSFNVEIFENIPEKR